MYAHMAMAVAAVTAGAVIWQGSDDTWVHAGDVHPTRKDVYASLCAELPLGAGSRAFSRKRWSCERKNFAPVDGARRRGKWTRRCRAGKRPESLTQISPSNSHQGSALLLTWRAARRCHGHCSQNPTEEASHTKHGWNRLLLVSGQLSLGLKGCSLQGSAIVCSVLGSSASSMKTVANHHPLLRPSPPRALPSRSCRPSGRVQRGVQERVRMSRGEGSTGAFIEGGVARGAGGSGAEALRGHPNKLLSPAIIQSNELPTCNMCSSYLVQNSRGGAGGGRSGPARRPP